jgi:hypothetical protein
MSKTSSVSRRRRLTPRSDQTLAKVRESGFFEQSKRRSKELAERRILAVSMCRASSRPTRVVRVSSRRITTVTARPRARFAGIRVINPSSQPSTGASSVPGPPDGEDDYGMAQ